MDWAPIARAQGGVISRAQLRTAGLGDDAIDMLATSAAIERLWRGVFLVRGAPLTYEARLWASALSFDGVLGFATAAHLWGMAERPDDIEVIVARNRHLWRQPGVRTHRIDLRPWALGCRQGLPITTRRETALDHIGRLGRSEYAGFADRAVQRGWLLPRDFEDRVVRQPGRIGNTRLRLLSQSIGDGAAARSERVLHRLLRGAGVDGWVANHDVWCNGELIAVVDVALPALRIAIEVDGWAWHSGPDRFQRDRTRQNDLVGLGWTVLRFTWADLVERPSYVIATVRRHLAQSGSVSA